MWLDQILKRAPCTSLVLQMLYKSELPEKRFKNFHRLSQLVVGSIWTTEFQIHSEFVIHKIPYKIPMEIPVFERTPPQCARIVKTPLLGIL